MAKRTCFLCSIFILCVFNSLHLFTDAFVFTSFSCCFCRVFSFSIVRSSSISYEVRCCCCCCCFFLSASAHSLSFISHFSSFFHAPFHCLDTTSLILKFFFVRQSYRRCCHRRRFVRSFSFVISHALVMYIQFISLFSICLIPTTTRHNGDQTNVIVHRAPNVQKPYTHTLTHNPVK